MKLFLSGTMQGKAKDMTIASQDYRSDVTNILKRHYPNITVIDPLHTMLGRFSDKQEELFGAFANLTKQSFVKTETLSNDIKEVVATFHDLMESINDCDILLAVLPNDELSMGTAMEMWHAKLQGKFVIAITQKKHNLAILSSSDIICHSIANFEEMIINQDIDLTKYEK